MVAAKAGDTAPEATLAAATATVPETKVRLFKSTSMGNGPRHLRGFFQGVRTPFKYGNCGDFASAAAPQRGTFSPALLVSRVVRPAHPPDIVGGGVFAVAQPGHRLEGQGIDPA